MQVAKINLFRNVNYPNIKKAKTSFNKSNASTDTFTKSNQISFKATLKDLPEYSIDWGYSNLYVPTDEAFVLYYPKQRKLNILKGDEAHLKDVAESICLYSKEDIVNFIKIYNPFREVNVKKSEKAFARIFPYIMEQKEKMVNLLNIKENLEHKKETTGLTPDEKNGLQYLLEEIERITKKNVNAKDEYLKSVHVAEKDDSVIWDID